MFMIEGREPLQTVIVFDPSRAPMPIVRRKNTVLRPKEPAFS